MAAEAGGVGPWLARHLGLRARTAAIATLVVGGALAVGGAGLVWAVEDALTEAVRVSAVSRARDLGVLAEQGALPERLPSHGEALVAQVLAADGAILAASVDLLGAVAVAPAPVGPGELVELPFVWPELEDDEGPDAGEGVDSEEEEELAPAWLVAYGVETTSGPVTVLVVAPLHGVEETTELLASILAAALPLLLLATAMMVWQLVGRTLRPVEAMRARASAIRPEDLKDPVSLPVPPARDEVRRLALTLNDLLARLRESSLARRRFVADAAHELRSPIAAMRTMLEVARDYPAAVDADELVRDLLREDLRLERLADDLLTLARQDEHGLVLRRAPLDPRDLLREEVATARLHHGLTVSLEEHGSVLIQADGHALRRLLRNLLDNAARHATGQVWVSVDVGDLSTDELRRPGLARPLGVPESAPSELTLTIRVSDDGPGIPIADRERIFERFVRLDAARSRAAGGAGLGLAVARAVAEAHGGALTVVETVHGGATFELRLPVAKNAATGLSAGERN